MVAKKGGNARWRPVEVEQMKTGRNDQPLRAQEQNAKALTAMQEIAAGNKQIRLFDRTGKSTLGEDLTSHFDLSALHEVNSATRGTQGKGFNRDVPFTSEILEAVARSLLEPGLPPAYPQPLPPLSSGLLSKEAAQ